MLARIIDDIPVFSTEIERKPPVLLSLHKSGAGFRSQAMPYVEFSDLVDEMASHGYIHAYGKHSEMVRIAEIYLLDKTISKLDGIERKLLESHRWNAIKHTNFTCLSPRAYKAIKI